MLWIVFCINLGVYFFFNDYVFLCNGLKLSIVCYGIYWIVN